MDDSIFFVCRNDVEIGVFYVNVFVVEFTAVKIKINIDICSDQDCSEL